MNTAFPERFRIAAARVCRARNATPPRSNGSSQPPPGSPQAEKAAERGTRAAAAALNEATAVQAEAQHWVDMKRNLPTELQQMAADHQTLEHWDFAPDHRRGHARRNGLAAEEIRSRHAPAGVRAIPADGE